MNRKITIHIDGPAGHGKTTLARYIATDLAVRHGVKVTYNDDGRQQQVPAVHETLPNYFDAEVTINVEQR